MSTCVTYLEPNHEPQLYWLPQPQVSTTSPWPPQPPTGHPASIGTYTIRVPLVAKMMFQKSLANPIALLRINFKLFIEFRSYNENTAGL